MDHRTLIKKLFASYQTAAQPETVAIYLEFLSEFDLPTLTSTINGAIKTCKFLPTVAELRTIAEQTKQFDSAWATPARMLEEKTDPPRVQPYITSREEEKAQLTRWDSVNKRYQEMRRKFK